jgi:hypothetical protein
MWIKEKNQHCPIFSQLMLRKSDHVVNVDLSFLPLYGVTAMAYLLAVVFTSNASCRFISTTSKICSMYIQIYILFNLIDEAASMTMLSTAYVILLQSGVKW